MTFTVPSEFLFQMFLDDCSVQGVQLYADDAHPTPDGCASLQGGLLTVLLVVPDQAKSDIITAAVEAQGGSPA